MGATTYTQEDSRFRNDDGSMTTATYMSGANNDPKSINVDTPFRLRSVVQVGGMGSGNQNYTMFAQKNGAGGFTQVTPGRSDGLQLANDANSIADDAATATGDPRIGDGTYTSGTSNGYCDGTTDNDTGAVNIDTGEEAETEFCMAMPGADAADTDYWDLRVYRGATALNTYPGTDIRVTAIEAAPPSDDMLPWDFKKRRFEPLLVR